MKALFRLPTLVALVLGGTVVVAYVSYRAALAPFRAFPGDEVFVVVSPGESSASIAHKLEASGVIKDQALFLAALRLRGQAGRLQAGEYRFTERASTFDVIDRLVDGDVFYVAVTIPEGLTLFETAELLGSKALGSAEEYREIFGNGALVAAVDPEAQDLEGYLFPETYRLPRNPKPEEVARALVARFVSVFDQGRLEKAKARGGVRQVVTLASVVEKETGLAEERRLIASVFWNRLKRQIPLQSDPTVIYGLKRQGRFDGNLSRTDLEADDAYNTYANRGLPPGPIASPGRDAIDAVLEPADSSYLYFVSRNDGSHQFSATLEEHNAAVRKYQIEYFRDRRRRQTDMSPSSGRRAARPRARAG
jgi:UPF0755 protein